MTYKKIYKLLEQEVETIIQSYDVSELMDTKTIIIEVIEYIEYFYSSRSYRQMAYWWDCKRNIKFQTIYKKLVASFCEKMQEKNNKENKKLEYWRDTVKDI